MSLETRNTPYVNREISWLRFNERVLEEAEDERLPLFERLRFLSIFGSNLDEFFMVRVGGLQDAMEVTPDQIDKKSRMTVSEQLQAIYGEVHNLMPRAERCYMSLMELFGEHKIYQVNTAEPTAYQVDIMKKYFHNAVMPYLSPQIVDKHHPFPFLDNKEKYVGLEFATDSNKLQLAVIPVLNKNFPRYFVFPNEKGDGYNFATTANLVCYFADELFTGKKINDKFLFRVTRNGDLRFDEASFDEEVDWRDQMEKIIKKRRLSSVVRLQMSKAVSPQVQRYLLKKLNADARTIIVTPHMPLSLNFIYGFLGEIESQYPDLNYGPMPPQMPAHVNPGDSVIRYIDKHGDLFLCYPYHSMKPFLDMLDEAAVDPEVTSIRITLYRIASGSKVAQALAKAAENGKDVMVLVELKARFDEEHNIKWSKRLEEAGCQVIYGFDNYKVHSKLCVITRSTAQGLKYITQIGTGNYNEKTARQYTDFSLITSNADIAKEALDVFETLSMGSFVEKSHYLLVAPLQMLTRFIDLIDEQIALAKSGQGGRIIAKFNGLSHKGIIDKLVEASQAGVKITLYVRGICCLRAGVPGYTDNITIKSMVGRFLEHPRFFIFGQGQDEKIYIGSADWMTRNLNYRVEVAVQILDPAIQATIHQIADILAADNMLARLMQPDGTYQRLYPGDGDPEIDSQTEQYRLFKQRKEESLAEQEEQSRKNPTVLPRTPMDEEHEPYEYGQDSDQPVQSQPVQQEAAGAQKTEAPEVQEAPASAGTQPAADQEPKQPLPVPQPVTMVQQPKGFWQRLKFVLFGHI
jgi:polyphosphate kinase